MAMAPDLTQHLVLRQRILSVLASTESGSLGAGEVKDVMAKQFKWKRDDFVPFPSSQTAEPKWKTRTNIQRNRMADEGLIDREHPFEWRLTALGWAEAEKFNTGNSSHIRNELTRRENLWTELHDAGGPNDVTKSMLRNLGLYGGASGIFVNQAETKSTTSPSGIAVSLLHTGKDYDDELTATGVVYHYPKTNRTGHDESEIEAAKAAYRLGMPIFVITPGSTAAKRCVKRGYIEDIDDAREALLVTFTNGILPPPPAQEDIDAPFQLTDKDPGGTWSSRRNRPNQARFAFDVLKRYGDSCAVCDVSVPGLVQAAHLLSKKKSGSDDPRNGLPLCANHHIAFDRGYWCLDPERNLHVRNGGPGLTDLGITRADLGQMTRFPHADAVSTVWRAWKASQER